MEKLHKKIWTIFLIVFFIGLISFFCFPTDNFLAVALEVEYPKLQSGAEITPQTKLPEYLKYVFEFGIFIGFFAVFLSLVFAGVMYLLSPAVPDALSMAKDRVSGAISGLLILSALYLIMVTINPGLAIFKMEKLEPIPPLPEPPAPEGVYFYNDISCSDSDLLKHSAVNIPDLGDAKNIIHSVKIEGAYISVLYNSTNYWGKCQYINPNIGCDPVDSFADSASVHKFVYSPRGDVHFYRNSFFSKQGGYFTVKADDIWDYQDEHDSIYEQELKELKFVDSSAIREDNPEGCTVPEQERDCAQWDEKAVCIKKSCPSLAGENISSIKIEGNYIVMLVYFNSTTDESEGAWSFCQEFPTINDVNREGPYQIKWEGVRQMGPPPNYVMIIPVARK